LYTGFFHLRELPFALEPDSRFLVLDEEHKEALATLIYAIEQREGWALLLGEAGVGKTTLIMALLRELGEVVIPAVITNPLLEPLDFFNLVALELGMDGPYASKGQFLIALGQLINQCRQDNKVLLLVIDEAHSLTPRLLEELRLLGNLDGASPRVLNIFLVGQPKVLLLMKKAGARGLMQRLHRHYLLKPLSAADTAQYVRHRLQVAGGTKEIFNDEALGEVHRLTGGNPRLINALCDEAMILAYGQDKQRVDAAMVREAGEHDSALSWSEPAAPLSQIEEASQARAAEEKPFVKPADEEPETRPAASEEPPAPGPRRKPLKPRQSPPPGESRRFPAKPETFARGLDDSLEANLQPPRGGKEAAAQTAKERKTGLGSRLAASMSKKSRGGLWRRLLFLIFVLLIIGIAYVLTSQDGLQQAKRWWWILKGRPGPELYLPSDDNRPTRRDPSRSIQQPDAGEKDWGPKIMAPAPKTESELPSGESPRRQGAPNG